MTDKETYGDTNSKKKNITSEKTNLPPKGSTTF